MTRSDTPKWLFVNNCLRTVATLALSKITQRSEKINLTQVGAKRFNKIEFAVSRLPQHEIRDSLFARRTNHEVEVWLTGGVEVRRNGVEGDVIRKSVDPEPGGLMFANDVTDGFRNFVAAAVPNREIDVQSRVMGGRLRRIG